MLRGARGRPPRARGARARAGGCDLRPRACRAARDRGRRALPHGAARARSSPPPRRAAGSTGTTSAFERAYAELEAIALRGDGGSYAAIAPLVGLSVCRGRWSSRRASPCATLRARRALDALAGVPRPAARRVRPRAGPLLRARAATRSRRRGRRARRTRRDRRRGQRDPPDDLGGARCRPGPLRDARRPPVRRPARAPDRCDAAARRAVTARRVPGADRGRRCSRRSADADGDPELAEALDRWELSLFQNEPFRAEQLRASLAALLGETWPLALLGAALEQDGRRGRSCTASSSALAGGDAASTAAARRRPAGARGGPPGARSSRARARARPRAARPAPAHRAGWRRPSRV